MTATVTLYDRASLWKMGKLSSDRVARVGFFSKLYLVEVFQIIVSILLKFEELQLINFKARYLGNKRGNYGNRTSRLRVPRGITYVSHS